MYRTFVYGAKKELGPHLDFFPRPVGHLHHRWRDSRRRQRAEIQPADEKVGHLSGFVEVERFTVVRKEWKLTLIWITDKL